MTMLNEFMDWLRAKMGAEAMAAVFMVLLRMARSKRQLQRLHGLLPLNCQLLQPDFIRLEEVWAEMYPRGRRAREISDNEARGKLVAACGMANLLPYYVRQKLCCQGISSWPRLLHDPSRTALCAERYSETRHEAMFVESEVTFDAVLDMTSYGGTRRQWVKLTCHFAASCFEHGHNDEPSFYACLEFSLRDLNWPFVEFIRKGVESGNASLSLPVNAFLGDFNTSAMLTLRFGEEVAMEMAMLVNPPEIQFVEIEEKFGEQTGPHCAAKWSGTWPRVAHGRGVIRADFCPAVTKLLAKVGFSGAEVAPGDYRRLYDLPIVSAVSGEQHE